MTRFLLASQSPRRKELLGLSGYPFDVIASRVEEASIDHPDPATNVLQTARLKAKAIYKQLLTGELLPREESESTIIIAADTIVALGDKMLGKPVDTADAVHMLRELRGGRHEVHTGMALVDGDSGEEATAVHTAYVTMRDYSDREIERYVAGGDPMDKAGAYAIQNRFFSPVESLKGCYLGVMGLTICQLGQLLEQLDIPVLTDRNKLAAAHDHHPCPFLL